MTHDAVVQVPWEVACEPPCGPAVVSVAITAPRGLPPGARVPVVFAWPGGGYTKTYFDLQPPGLVGYSMARHLARLGIVVVACDNLGTGASTRPTPAERLTLDDMIAANEAVRLAVLPLLADGGLEAHGVRVDPVPIGLGHSMGAGLVTVHQARHEGFAGVALLGRALSGSLIPAPPARPGDPPEWVPPAEQHADFVAYAEIVDGYYVHRHHTPWQRYLFFWEGTPEELIEYDERHGTTFPLHVARELGTPGGPNHTAASLVTVPVLLAFGERDVTQDPLAEVSAYRGSRDIRVITVPQSAHCHNHSLMRHWLWDRIAEWSLALTRAA